MIDSSSLIVFPPIFFTSIGPSPRAVYGRWKSKHRQSDEVLLATFDVPAGVIKRREMNNSVGWISPRIDNKRSKPKDATKGAQRAADDI